MDTKTPLKFPKFNWDKILVRIAMALCVTFVLALVLRIRAILIAIEVIDTVLVLALLACAFFAIVQRFSKPAK